MVKYDAIGRPIGESLAGGSPKKQTSVISPEKPSTQQLISQSTQQNTETKYYLTDKGTITYRVGGSSPPPGSREIQESEYNIRKEAYGGKEVNVIYKGQETTATVNKAGELNVKLDKYTGDIISELPSKQQEARTGNTMLASEGFIKLYEQRKGDIQAIREKEALDKQHEQLKQSSFQDYVTGKPYYLLGGMVTQTEVKQERQHHPLNIIATNIGSAITKGIKEKAESIGIKGKFKASLQTASEGLTFATPYIREERAKRIEGSNFLGKQISYLEQKRSMYETKSYEERGIYAYPMMGLAFGKGVLEESRDFYTYPLEKTVEYGSYAGLFMGGEKLALKISEKTPGLKKISKETLSKAFTGIGITGAVIGSSSKQIIEGENPLSAISESSGKLAVPIIGAMGLSLATEKGMEFIDYAKGREITKTKLVSVDIQKYSYDGTTIDTQIQPLLKVEQQKLKPFQRLPETSQVFAVEIKGKTYAELSPNIKTEQEASGYAILQKTKEGELKLAAYDIKQSTPKIEITQGPTSLFIKEQLKYSLPLKQKIEVKPYERVTYKDTTIHIREDIGYTESGIPIEGLKNKDIYINEYPWIQEKVTKVKGHTKEKNVLYSFGEIPEKQKGKPLVVSWFTGKPTKIKNLPTELMQQIPTKETRSGIKDMFKEKRAELNLEQIQRTKTEQLKPKELFTVEAKSFRENFGIPITKTSIKPDRLVSNIISNKPISKGEYTPNFDIIPVTKPKDIEIIKQIPRQIILTKDRIITTPDLVKPSKTPPIDFDIYIPPPEPGKPTGFIGFSLGLTDKNLGGGFGNIFKSKRAYTPSLTAMAFNIRKKGKINTKRIFSPTELRPIIG